MDKIVDVVIDTAVDLLPDNIEPYVEPFADPAKEIISDTLETVLHIEPPKVELPVDAKDSEIIDATKKIKRKKSEN